MFCYLAVRTFRYIVYIYIYMMFCHLATLVYDYIYPHGIECKSRLCIVQFENKVTNNHSWQTVADWELVHVIYCVQAA